MEQRSTDNICSVGWFRKFKRWQTFKLARARWAEGDGDQRTAAFGHYLLLSLPPLTLLVVAAGSLFVEREVATQGVVKLVNHYTPLASEQERGAVATDFTFRAAQACSASAFARRGRRFGGK